MSAKRSTATKAHSEPIIRLSICDCFTSVKSLAVIHPSPLYEAETGTARTRTSTGTWLWAQVPQWTRSRSLVSNANITDLLHIKSCCFSFWGINNTHQLALLHSTSWSIPLVYFGEKENEIKKKVQSGVYLLCYLWNKLSCKCLHRNTEISTTTYTWQYIHFSINWVVCCEVFWFSIGLSLSPV